MCIRDRTRAGERDLRVRVLALDEVGVQAGRERVPAEVGQAEQRREAHAAHAAHQRTLLRVQAVGEDALMSAKVQGLVLSLIHI